MRRFVVFAVSVPLTVLMMVACGEDEETLTTEEFLEQGNAICEAGAAEVDAAVDAAAAEEFPEGEVPEAPVSFVDVAAPIFQEQLDDLEALDPPEDLQGDADEMLEAAQSALDSVTDDPDSIFGEENPFAEADNLAIEVGLTACAGD